MYAKQCFEAARKSCDLNEPLPPPSQVEVAQKRVLDAESQRGRAESQGSDHLALISELRSHLVEKEGLVVALQEEAESLQGQLNQQQTEVGGVCSNCWELQVLLAPRPCPLGERASGAINEISRFRLKDNSLVDIIPSSHSN